MLRICRDWPGLFRFDKVAEYSGDWRMGATWSWSVFMARIYVIKPKYCQIDFFLYERIISNYLYSVKI